MMKATTVGIPVSLTRFVSRVRRNHSIDWTNKKSEIFSSQSLHWFRLLACLDRTHMSCSDYIREVNFTCPGKRDDKRWWDILSSANKGKCILRLALGAFPETYHRYTGVSILVRLPSWSQSLYIVCTTLESHYQYLVSLFLFRPPVIPLFHLS